MREADVGRVSSGKEQGAWEANMVHLRLVKERIRAEPVDICHVYVLSRGMIQVFGLTPDP